MLFRAEVISLQNEKMSGKIILAQSIPMIWLTVGLVIAAILILMLLFFGKYTKRETAIGLLVPEAGGVRIIPPINGIVLERHVQEGQRVSQGEILFAVGDARNTTSNSSSTPLGDDVIKNINQKKNVLLSQRDAERRTNFQLNQGLTRRIDHLQIELQQLENEIQITHNRIDFAQKTVDRNRKLAETNFVSDQAVLEKEDILSDIKSKAGNLERLRTGILRDLDDTKNEITSNTNRLVTRLAEMDRDRVVLEQELTENIARYRYEITAPFNGVVTAILVQQGQVVTNQPIATLLSDKSWLEAQLFIPSRAAGFIKPGQLVHLRYQAYPYQKFGQYDGRVINVSRSQIQPADLPSSLPIQPKQNNEAIYLVTVKLSSQTVKTYGESQELTSGMILEADIDLDTRTIFEWILEPLYALRGRL